MGIYYLPKCYFFLTPNWQPWEQMARSPKKEDELSKQQNWFKEWIRCCENCRLWQNQHRTSSGWQTCGWILETLVWNFCCLLLRKHSQLVRREICRCVVYCAFWGFNGEICKYDWHNDYWILWKPHIVTYNYWYKSTVNVFGYYAQIPQHHTVQCVLPIRSTFW